MTEDIYYEDNSLETFELFAMEKVCPDCGKIMKVLEASAAEVLNDLGKDMENMRIWAVCECDTVILLR